jgi:hypothetical protein
MWTYLITNDQSTVQILRLLKSDTSHIENCDILHPIKILLIKILLLITIIYFPTTRTSTYPSDSLRFSGEKNSLQKMSQCTNTHAVRGKQVLYTTLQNEH